MSSRIIVVGSSNTDMVVKTNRIPKPGETVVGGDFFMNPGGKGANQAVAAARLGGQVALVANLGNDLFGQQALQQFQSEGIDCAFITLDTAHPSGVALITVDAKGENNIVVAPGANGHLTSEQAARALGAAEPGTVALAQLEIPLATVAEVIRLGKQHGLKVIINPAPAATLPDELLNGLFALTPNEHEAGLLTGIAVTDTPSAERAAAWLLNKGVQHVLITLGADGVLLSSAAGHTHIPTPRVKAIDTTAAGDCFSGALAVGIAAGLPLSVAASRACQAAAISVTRLGAQASMPRAHELT